MKIVFLIFILTIAPLHANAEDASGLDINAPIASFPLPHKKTTTAKSEWKFKGLIKTIATAEDNRDLGTRRDDSDAGLAADATFGVRYAPQNTDMRIFTEARAYKSTDDLTGRDEDGTDLTSTGFVELRQAWVEFYKLLGNSDMSARLGRQRFREERGLWWNKDFDAARLSYDTEATSGFIAAGHNIDNYRIGENDEFREEDKDRLRFLGEAIHRYTPDHRIEGRFLYQDDHSGAPRTGTIVNAADWDREDADLLWLGLRAAGKIPLSDTGLSYRVDGLAVRGEETLSSAAAGPGTGQRLITGSRGRDVMGWAADAEVGFDLPHLPLSPAVRIGYAYGSGESNPNGTDTDSSFRQSDMHSNTSPFASKDGQGRARHYGEVLRPELSNIHILSIGAYVPLTWVTDSGLSFDYFTYWLDEKSNGLRSSGIDAPVNGRDSHLGQAFDVTLFLPLIPRQEANDEWMDSLSSRFVFGGFKAGEAYGAADNEYAWRGTAELRFKF